MSASGGQSPREFIAQASGYESLAQLIRDGIGGTILATFTQAIRAVGAVASLLLVPFVLLVDVARESVNNFILVPMGIVPIGADVTAGELSVLGLFALPVSVVIALGTFLIVILYLQWRITGNIIPGIFVDNRLVDFIFTSPEEEAAGED